MITGIHAILDSADPGADRAFLRDVLGFGSVDAGDGWLIFAAPPAEIAVHPSDEGGGQHLYLMCEDVHAEVARLAASGVACPAPVDRGWGILTSIPLPGGGELGLYQPRHPTPHAHPAG
jgi:hypothetical protein